jgi:APAF-1 helical domain
VRAIDNHGKPKATDDLSQRYFYQHLPDHLAAAGERGRLDRVLLDPFWLKAKLAATNNSQALVADYDRHSVSELQTLIAAPGSAMGASRFRCRERVLRQLQSSIAMARNGSVSLSDLCRLICCAMIGFLQSQPALQAEILAFRG